MRISDWSSDVCSSDLWAVREAVLKEDPIASQLNLRFAGSNRTRAIKIKLEIDTNPPAGRSEEHTSELQSLMRISYAVFCLKQQTRSKEHTDNSMRNRYTKPIEFDHRGICTLVSTHSYNL